MAEVITEMQENKHKPPKIKKINHSQNRTKPKND